MGLALSTVDGEATGSAQLELTVTDNGYKLERTAHPPAPAWGWLLTLQFGEWTLTSSHARVGLVWNPIPVSAALPRPRTPCRLHGHPYPMRDAPSMHHPALLLAKKKPERDESHPDHLGQWL